eukprot:jgi/Chrzof1/1891/Cz10g25050.t1
MFKTKQLQQRGRLSSVLIGASEGAAAAAVFILLVVFGHHSGLLKPPLTQTPDLPRNLGYLELQVKANASATSPESISVAGVGWPFDVPATESITPDEQQQQQQQQQQLLSTIKQAAAAADQSSSLIPKLIHQSWKHKDLPDFFRTNSASWTQHHQQWQYKLWTDDENHQLVASHFPWFLDIYQAFENNIERADSARYMYMYMFGGVYVDLDIEALKPVDSLLQGHDVVLAYMGSDPTFSNSIPNAFLASVPHHPFWLMMLFNIKLSWQPHFRPEFTTGPAMLKRTLEQFWDPSANGKAIHILDPGVIYPYDWHRGSLPERVFCAAQSRRFDAEQCKRFYPPAFAVSYWSHSWEGPAPAVMLTQTPSSQIL